ncbi:MAG: (deoxy)nucleoside triphosphate pyrophosphohydrolase [Treponema sp.]|jgi:8-oxo-dGTP diphosphatase|nr:(deoxy)nucleoside triphosphate pyrophosphohydrolase [Treponema sp.]
MKATGVSVAGIARRGERLFIARRLPHGSLGNKWEFPGGKVEAGETEPEALVREFQEEFSLSIRVGGELARAVFTHKGVKRSLRAYLIDFETADPAKNLVLHEHVEWKWALIGEIEQLDFAPSDLKILPALKAYLKANP